MKDQKQCCAESLYIQQLLFCGNVLNNFVYKDAINDFSKIYTDKDINTER